MLKEILECKRYEVRQAKRWRPGFRTDRKSDREYALSRGFEQTPWALIAECKLASPAKGRLSSYGVTDLAEIYEHSGATALSVLTDRHFHGGLDDLRLVRQVTNLPLLRKDFIIDEYQIYESREAGADAILLIAGILSDSQLAEYYRIAQSLGLDCLVEVHNLEELQRVQKTPARIIGINNRDLATFTTDIQTTLRLLPHCEEGRIIISESGIKGAAEAHSLRAAGVRGILVGEGLVKAPDIAAAVKSLALTGEDAK